MGGPDSGKTVFSLQTLVNAARRRDEPGIFVAFEETTRRIIANAACFNWGLPAPAKKKIFFLEAHLSPEVVQSGEFDLSGMLAMLKAKKQEMGARWIVFDGIDVLLTLLHNPIAEMREIFRPVGFGNWIATSGLPKLSVPTWPASATSLARPSGSYRLSFSAMTHGQAQIGARRAMVILRC